MTLDHIRHLLFLRAVVNQSDLFFTKERCTDESRIASNLTSLSAYLQSVSLIFT